MMLTMSTTQPPKPKRRWYQFSLRTLLVVMLVSCIGFAWIGSRMKQARENRDRVAAVEETVAAIEKLGGEVTSEYEDRRPQSWLEKQFDDPGSADDPVGDLKVHRIDLSQTGRGITDAGLEHLKGMTNLEVLDLGYCRNITDAGLEHLKNLKNLQVLELNFTNVTDAGIGHLKGLANLQSLNLFHTTVSDAGLEHLKGLKNLQCLILAEAGGIVFWETKITDEGVKKLQQALPNCEIVTSLRVHLSSP